MNPLLTDIRNRFQNIFKNRRLIFTMNNIVQITGLSRTRINYWEKKGYIHSVSHQRNRTRMYNYVTLMKIELMQSYLRSGFTLKIANQKASQGEKYGMLVHNIVVHRIKQVTTIDGHPAVDFGPLKPGDLRHIFFVQEPNGKIITKYLKINQ